MCGRFQATTSAAELARVFKTAGPLPNLQQRYNAAPTQSLPTVLHDRTSGERRLEALCRGLIPYWANDTKIAYSTVNAKAETVATAPAFRDAFKRRRCLVPADGFYEWQKGEGKTKQPYRFAMADGAPFAFAGLWERWKEPTSGTIITTTPNALCAPIHNRMPVILNSADYAAWLGEAPAIADGLHGLLRPFPAERMVAHMVGPRIGNVKNDDVALIERWNST
jgi:putative SOS response-associated peptidase YedK